MSSKRFTAQGWLELGLKRLAQGGPEALTLEAICAAAGKTRGSFYHHFKDHGGFLKALVGYWRERNSLAVMRNVAEQAGAARKLKELDSLSRGLSPEEELGVRRLATARPELAHLIAEVDRERVAFLAQLRQADLGIDESEAVLLSEIEYAAFIGHMTLWPGACGNRREEASALFSKVVKRAYASARKA